MSASRLKGKPLLKINNLPIICHVLNKARDTGLESIVATEDNEILQAIKNSVGGKVILTGNHRTGTDRIFEAFKRFVLMRTEVMQSALLFSIKPIPPMLQARLNT